MTDKQIIRRQMIKQREALTADECQVAAAGIRDSLLALLAVLDPDRQTRNEPLRIGVYSSIRKELDLSLTWPDLLKWPACLYFPAVQGKGSDARLVFGRLPDDCLPQSHLICGCFGIAEPPVSELLEQPPLLDIILLPGLAFDHAGNRLGWGKAYYDRLIPTLPGKPVLVGVGYDFQILAQTLPAEPTDRPVDWLLTPSGAFAAHSVAVC